MSDSDDFSDDVLADDGIAKAPAHRFARRTFSRLILVNQDGPPQILDLRIDLPEFVQFQHGGRSYQCYRAEERDGIVAGLCREIPGSEFGYASNTKAMVVEDELVTFFAPRAQPLAVGQVTETSIRHAVLSALSPHFHVREEVWGRHISGQPVAIDSILDPKERASWRADGLAFGIEFKGLGGSSARGQSSVDVLAQCVDYAVSRFPGVGNMLVFLCPVPAGLRTEERLWRFVARYNVGFVDLRDGELRFRWAMQEVWSESGGLTTLGRRGKFTRRFGNRSPC